MSNIFQRFFRASIHISVVMLAVTIAAVAGFLIFFKPQPVVSVPYMVGKSFVDASILLQDKRLYPFVTFQYTNDPLQKGTIIDQDPLPGSAVRSKSEIALTVSKGAVIAEIPDYQGLLYSDIVQDIDSQFSGLDSLLEIAKFRKSFHNQAPPNIVVAQDPLPGSKITQKNTQISFVISRGVKKLETTMPDIVGLSFEELYELLENIDAKFDFYISEAKNTFSEQYDALYKVGSVIEQNPPAGFELSNPLIQNSFRIGIRAYSETSQSEENNENEQISPQVDILEITLPEYEEPRTIVIQKRDGGEDEFREVISLITRGGAVTFPYFVVSGTRYNVSMDGNIVWRYAIP